MSTKLEMAKRAWWSEEQLHVAQDQVTEGRDVAPEKHRRSYGTVEIGIGTTSVSPNV